MTGKTSSESAHGVEPVGTRLEAVDWPHLLPNGSRVVRRSSPFMLSQPKFEVCSHPGVFDLYA